MVRTQMDAFVVDPNLDTRMRLKQVTASVHTFGKVHLFGALREAMSKLSGSEPADVVFVSHAFGADDVAHFVQSAKATKQGEDSAYVLVLGTREQDSATVASNILVGTDGFLFEPYSVESLVEIVELASRVKGERAKGREEKAIRMLVIEAAQRFESIASLHALGADTSRHMARLKEKLSLLYKLSPESLVTYANVAAEIFGAAVAPRKNYLPGVAESSTRAKQRMREKLAEKLDKELESTP